MSAATAETDALPQVSEVAGSAAAMQEAAAPAEPEPLRKPNQVHQAPPPEPERQPAPKPKRRGRPPGAKNKPKPPVPTTVPIAAEEDPPSLDPVSAPGPVLAQSGPEPEPEEEPEPPQPSPSQMSMERQLSRADRFEQLLSRNTMDF